MPPQMTGRRAAMTVILVFTLGLAGASTFAQAPTTYRPPHTAWGDPDFQGNYTNLYEAGTPLERPDQFAGRKLEQATGSALATVKKQIQERTIQQFETPFDAPSNWWQVAFSL